MLTEAIDGLDLTLSRLRLGVCIISNLALDLDDDVFVSISDNDEVGDVARQQATMPVGNCKPYGVAVITQILIFPIFGLHTTLAQNLKMGAIFTVVSIARSFALRRMFEAVRMRERNGQNCRKR